MVKNLFTTYTAFSATTPCEVQRGCAFTNGGCMQSLVAAASRRSTFVNRFAGTESVQVLKLHRDVTRIATHPRPGLSSERNCEFPIVSASMLHFVALKSTTYTPPIAELNLPSHACIFSTWNLLQLPCWERELLKVAATVVRHPNPCRG